MFAIILILCACKSNKTGGDALVEQDSISTELNDDPQIRNYAHNMI